MGELRGYFKDIKDKWYCAVVQSKGGTKENPDEVVGANVFDTQEDAKKWFAGFCDGWRSAKFEKREVAS